MRGSGREGRIDMPSLFTFINLWHWLNVRDQHNLDNSKVTQPNLWMVQRDTI